MENKLTSLDRKKIKELKKMKKYNDIFTLYGSKVFLQETSFSFMLKDIKKLLKEGKFIDIQNKYSYETNDFLMGIYLYTDILNNSDKLYFAKSTRLLWFLKRLTAKSLLLVFSVTMTLIIVFLSTIKGIELTSKQKYADEIKEYNEVTNEYVNNLDLENKSDLEIVMQVVSDMWKSIDGYKEPEINAAGYFRLDILNGYGVCRNMADDITTKLNLINPEYNARNLVVYATWSNFYMADIERNILTQESPSREEEETENEMENKSPLLGNHMVTLIDIPDENYTLVVDATNPSIGILKNGKIHLLNGPESTIEIKKINNLIINGLGTALDLNERIVNSYFIDEEIDVINDEYGIDAQNRALELKR